MVIQIFHPPDHLVGLASPAKKNNTIIKGTEIIYILKRWAWQGSNNRFRGYLRPQSTVACHEILFLALKIVWAGDRDVSSLVKQLSGQVGC